MIKNLTIKWPIKLNRSFMIGDQIKDELCASKSNLYFEYVSQNFFNQIKNIIKNSQ